MQGTGSDHVSCNANLKQVTDERNEYLRELDELKEILRAKEQTVTALSLRVEGMSVKSGTNGGAGQPIALTTADPNVVTLVNNLQEQLVVERNKNRQLKGA